MIFVDHMREAQRLIGATDTRDWKEPSPYVDRRIAASHAHAFLALAQQQYLATLINLTHEDLSALNNLERQTLERERDTILKGMARSIIKEEE